MSATTSATTGRRYGLKRVCRTWERSRSALYARRARVQRPARGARPARRAAELDLPMARGKVLFPDAQIEYVTAAGVGEVDQARNAERTER